MTRSTCFFNNKGGVGKTTLVCNVASYIATSYPYRVLVVDADPQCNTSQLVLPSAWLDKLYTVSRKRSTRTRLRPPTPVTTLYDVLEPIAKGEPGIADQIVPVSASENEFAFDLIPGHPLVALLEDRLSNSWLLMGGGDLGSARTTNWNTQLIRSIGDNYDLIFYDVGPSLGALNRTVLIGADFFLTPMGCDVFSIMGISNISQWLADWSHVYADSMRKCGEQWSLAEYHMKTDKDKLARFVGYTVQQYITKSKRGVRRPTVAFERIMAKIPETIAKELAPFFSPTAAIENLRLPDVPHMYSLVPLAQEAKVPIHRIEGAHGLAGAQYSQRDVYARFIKDLADAVLANIGLKRPT
jgi:cellulose biosynthesis protein BcsQ